MKVFFFYFLATLFGLKVDECHQPLKQLIKENQLTAQALENCKGFDVSTGHSLISYAIKSCVFNKQQGKECSVENVADLLVDKGLRLSGCVRNCPIATAAANGQTSIIEMLLSKNFVPSYNDFSICFSHEKEPFHLCRDRIFYSESADKDLFFYMAISHCNSNITSYLLNRGARREKFLNGIGMTPLGVASLHGCKAIVQMLIENENERLNSLPAFNLEDYRISLRNKGSVKGESPLMLAIRNHHLDVIDYLIDIAKVNVEYFTVNSTTALHEAIRSNNVTLFFKIISNINDLEFAENGNLTPLKLAISMKTKESMEMIRILCDRNVNIQDALQYSIMSRNNEAIHFFREKSKKIDAEKAINLLRNIKNPLDYQSALELLDLVDLSEINLGDISIYDFEVQKMLYARGAILIGSLLKAAKLRKVPDDDWSINMAKGNGMLNIFENIFKCVTVKQHGMGFVFTNLILEGKTKCESNLDNFYVSYNVLNTDKRKTIFNYALASVLVEFFNASFPVTKIFIFTGDFMISSNHNQTKVTEEYPKSWYKLGLDKFLSFEKLNRRINGIQFSSYKPNEVNVVLFMEEKTSFLHFSAPSSSEYAGTVSFSSDGFQHCNKVQALLNATLPFPLQYKSVIVITPRLPLQSNFNLLKSKENNKVSKYSAHLKEDKSIIFLTRMEAAFIYLQNISNSDPKYFQVLFTSKVESIEDNEVAVIKYEQERRKISYGPESYKMASLSNHLKFFTNFGFKEKDNRPKTLFNYVFIIDDYKLDKKYLPKDISPSIIYIDHGKTFFDSLQGDLKGSDMKSLASVESFFNDEVQKMSNF